MQPDLPLISIVIPVFNREKLIEETLNSVLSQTYTNWECLVVDDGSTDKTEVAVEAWTKKDVRIHYLKRPSNRLQGGNAARNFGFEQSQGDYIIFLDSDDLLVRSALSYRISKLGVQPIDMLISSTAVFQKHIGDSNLLWNTTISKSTVEDCLIRFFNNDMPWHTNGVTWSKNFLKLCGGWDETLKAWQDWELHCRSLFYEPNLEFSKEEPDNYYRYMTPNGIAQAHKSKSYIVAIKSAIDSIDILLRSNVRFVVAVPYYRKLVYRMLVRYPIANRSKVYPLNVLLKRPFYYRTSRIQFFYIYCIQFLGSSSKIRKHLIFKRFLKLQNSILVHSTHLKAIHQNKH